MLCMVEIEAEKKIRSKNSKIFLITIIGFGLLGLVFFQINDQNLEEATPFKEPTTPIKTAEVELAKQVLAVKDGSAQIPLPSIKEPKSINQILLIDKWSRDTVYKKIKY